jgi:xanthine dehydrogenase accessory factor
MIASLDEWPVFGFDDDARPALRAAAQAGRDAALATIVALDGGGPRPVGAQMVIAGDSVSGFLSGGCLEADVVGHARSVLEDGAPLRLVYGRGSPWPDIRLLCGARIEVQLERLAPDDPSIGALLALTDARMPATWLSDGRRRACALPGTATERWSGAFERRYLPRPRLVVIGADPTALAIAMLGVQSGSETTLVRPRGPVDPPPIQGVAYSRDEPGAALAHIGLDPWTAVAVATHDAELDHAALVVALPSRAFYVGALGARRRVPERVDELRRAGLSVADIGRLRAPIGLAIGGKAPWEVAVAVLAEITAARYAVAL